MARKSLQLRRWCLMKNTKYSSSVGRFVSERASGNKTFGLHKFSSDPPQVGRKKINNQWMSERVSVSLYFSTVNSKKMIRKDWWNSYCFSEIRRKQIDSIVILKDSEWRVFGHFINEKIKITLLTKHSSLKDHKLCIETTASIMQISPTIHKSHNNVKLGHLNIDLYLHN